MKPKQLSGMDLIGLLLLLLGLALLLTDYVSTSVFLSHGSSIPSPDEGRIYPVEIKRRLIYLSRLEQLTHEWAGISGLALSGFGIFLRMKAKNKNDH